ncbi:hypothetical protein K491DRAFT_686277 [Lophiostoma macrostomum CBS 122681]|uniref:Uncharacterized protein n=1 Tax=Lophiostoma macrostomum CBS 122681 TaxID=1314788 RepID=A0A6A6TTW0_9PLEO|nr:hypothetical protein K491DRAFT_686277 [Lophiostoma macrostomum CBS 122681]
MQRDEAVVQLKGLKKTEKDLNKALKEREAHLHQMEKQAKPYVIPPIPRPHPFQS